MKTFLNSGSPAVTLGLMVMAVRDLELKGWEGLRI